jgi:hypothetical protein
MSRCGLQYFYFMRNLLHGEMGKSIIFGSIRSS